MTIKQDVIAFSRSGGEVLFQIVGFIRLAQAFHRLVADSPRLIVRDSQ